jgi:fumarate hydratase subunit alpha
MRSEVVEATVRALVRAETSLPGWVVELLEGALQREKSPVALSQLQLMLANVRLAEEEGIPLCQDTGLLLFHVEVGRDLHLDFDLRDAIAEGVRKATVEIPLRPNAVDPLSRQNSGDNTGPEIPEVFLERIDGRSLRITAFPKGAGSENMSLLGMLNPSDDPWEFVLQAVAERAANACPPIFLGIGVGGSFALAPRLAKLALLRLPGRSPQELALLDRINSLGIGPMGLGGETTALGLKVERAFCHTASLPVAVNFQCWAHRCASEVVR